MAIRFQIRGGSKAEWTSANPVLMERELGIELDTRQVKIGDGFNEWSNLPYMTQGDTGLTGKDGPKGEKGDPFVYSDFTEAQLTGLIGPQGPKGEQGDPFVYGDFTHEQLEGLRGPTGTVSNLDEWNIMDTLGYIPVSPTELNEHKNDLTNPHKTSKTHVGLGNVDNVKQMPINDGTLQTYREKVVTVGGTSIINLNEGNVFVVTPVANRTYSIANAKNEVAHSFTLQINMGAEVITLTFPNSIKWQDGEIPDLTEPDKTYILTFMTTDGGTTWFGMLGGEF